MFTNNLFLNYQPIDYNTPEYSLKAKQKLVAQLNRSDNHIFYDFHPYGIVYFNQAIFQEENLQLFGWEVTKMFEHLSWTIDIKSQNQINQWNKRFKLIVQAQIFDLKIKSSITQLKLLMRIEHIDFFELKELTLYSCNIDNIERLTFVNAPKLRKINFIYNFATQYKLLKKSNFDLQEFMIYSMNQQQSQNDTVACPQLDHSSRWNFRPDLKLRLQKHPYNSIIMNDVSFFAKMKRIPPFFLCATQSKKNRIYQLNILKKLIKEKICQFQYFTRRQEQ